jgi:hypothetical protein
MTETYNPMSKEFQDECKKFGLTGRQLTAKYQKEGRYIEKCKKKVGICCNDKSHKTYISSGGYECWYKHKCQKTDCTGYLCSNCYQKYDSNSSHNKEKSKKDCRNNNLDPNSTQGIGYITATLVKKFLGIEDCFDITGNFNYPEYDMIEHENWGLVNAKGSSLITQDGYLYHRFGIKKNKKADFFFCIGYDKDRKHVLTVFIIPNDEYISELDTIAISYNRYSKYNIFKESEDEIKKWDGLFHTMKLDNCPVLRNG